MSQRTVRVASSLGTRGFSHGISLLSKSGSVSVLFLFIGAVSWATRCGGSIAPAALAAARSLKMSRREMVAFMGKVG